MLRFCFYMALGFLALFLESTILAYLPSMTLRFDLLFILLLSAAFSSTIRECGPIAVCLGLMEDMAGTPFIGFFASIYFLLAGFLRTFIAHMFVETRWARIFWIGIFSLMALSMEWGLLELIDRSAGLRQYLLTYALLQGLLNMAMAIILLPLLDHFERMIFSYSRGT